MKLLSIGNSFSQNAHKYLHRLAQANGIDIETVNLVIGGCSLERHRQNVTEDRADYALERNGDSCGRMIGIAEALAMEDWDVITLQQASHYSGMPETYEPYLSELVRVVREACPRAVLYFHQTWAYETDAAHSGFAAYHNDQREMYRRLCEASAAATATVGGRMIPAGNAIQRIREQVPAFDYPHGGLSLCADGFHLTDYGCYAIGAAWITALTGKTVAPAPLDDLDPALLAQITAVTNSL